MLRAAIAFFVLALISIVLGANNLAGLSMEIGKVLLFVFLALAVISFVVSLLTGGRSRPLPSVALFLALGSLGFSMTAHAETTTAEKVQEVGQDVAKNTKKAWRATKDAVCMKGDVECAAQKAKHKVQNAGDEISDKADDIKKKVN